GHGKGPKSVRACERCSMSSQTEKYFLLMRRRYLYESRVYCADTCSNRELPELGEFPETYSAVARYRAERSVLLYQHKGRVMHTVMPSKCYERHGTPRSFCLLPAICPSRAATESHPGCFSLATSLNLKL
ncbi:unnamed protein product, partial [Ascophyllum nodosum]